MLLKSLMVLEGPNIYCHGSVARGTVDISAWGQGDSRAWPSVVHRIVACLPGLGEHNCSRGQRGGFVERLREGTLVGHVLEHVALEFLVRAGQDVSFGKTRAVDKTRFLYDVVIGFDCREAALLALREGCLFLNSMRETDEGLDGQSDRDRMEVRRIVRGIERCVEGFALGPSTRHVLACCRDMHVPVRLYPNSLMRLGYGCRGRWMRAGMCELDSCIGAELAQDKELTRRLLRGSGLPVPLGRVVASECEARGFLRALGRPVVIKPCRGNQGRNVFAGLGNELQVAGAFRLAAARGTDRVGGRRADGEHRVAGGCHADGSIDAVAAGDGSVLAEEFVQGRHYRLLMINGELAAAACKEPARVVGDGRSTLAQLIEMCNKDPERGKGHGKMLTKIRLSQAEIFDLACRDWTPDCVPAKGRVVQVCSGANLSTGGTARDVTSLVHERYRRMAADAARCLGLSVAGVDMVMPDISCFEADKVKILEVNAAPGLRMHLPSDLGQKLVSQLFPDGEARIPLAAVTGSNGKSSVARMVAYGLARGGRVVGLTCSDGVYIGGEEILGGDRTGPESARCVLAHPRVEAAVLETARGGIMRGGLGYDWADVAVVTNVTGDHVGEFGVESLEDLLRVKALVVERVPRSGHVVLNADDGGARSLAQHVRGAVIYFSRLPQNRRIQQHIAVGGKAVLVLRGHIALAEGSALRYLCPLSKTALGRGTMAAEYGAARIEREDTDRERRMLIVNDVQQDVAGAVLQQLAQCLGQEEAAATQEQTAGCLGGQFVSVPKQGMAYIEESSGRTQSGSTKSVPGFMLENMLAAVAALWALGQSVDSIVRMLREFSPTHNAGRWEEYSLDVDVRGTIRPLRVILDYAHNPAALRAVAEVLRRDPGAGQDIIGCVGMPGNRRDEDILDFGRVAGEIFDSVYIKEDEELRGRPPGEAAALIRQGAASVGNSCLHLADSEREALREALCEARRRMEEQEGTQEGIVFVSYENLKSAREAYVWAVDSLIH